VIELLGNKPIGEYSIIDGRDFRTSLLKIPKNRKRVKRYRDKTLKEVLEMDIPESDKMSFHNVTKLISRMSSLWNFFVDEYPEYVTQNVFKSKSIRVNPQKMKDRREEFSEDDLHLIWSDYYYSISILLDTDYCNPHRMSFRRNLYDENKRHNKNKWCLCLSY